MTPRVREILSWYQGDAPVVLDRLARVLGHGEMAGTGKLIIADVSDGVENGPGAAFHGNPDSYDPILLFRMASECRISALIAPQGMIELCARDFAGEVPLFLKVSHTVVLNSWKGSYQSSTLEAAHRLGCTGVTFALPIGADDFAKRVDDLAIQINEAKKLGLLAMVSITRAGTVDDEKKREALPIDQLSQAMHMVCQLGAHIVEAPAIDQPVVGLRDWYSDRQISIKNQEARAEQLMLSAMQKQRIVIMRFSRHWSEDQKKENLVDWTSAGATGVDLGSHAYTHPKLQVSEEIKQYKNVLLGEQR